MGVLTPVHAHDETTRSDTRRHRPDRARGRGRGGQAAQPVPRRRQAAAAALSRPPDEEAVRAVRGSLDRPRPDDAARRQLDRQRGHGPRRAVRRAHQPVPHARPPADLPPRRRADRDPHRRAPVLQVRGRADPLLEVPLRGEVRAVADRLQRPAHPQGASRPEGELLPARPAPHTSPGPLPAEPRVPRVQHQPPHAQGPAGHVGGVVGHLSAELPRAVPGRDGPARVLRLPRDGRPAQRGVREQRAQQLVPGVRAAAVQARRAAVREPGLGGPVLRRRRPRRLLAAGTLRASAGAGKYGPSGSCVQFAGMAKTLVVAEKPSVARDLAAALPGSFQQNKDKASLEGDDYVVTWAVGHLVGLAEPDA